MKTKGTKNQALTLLGTALALVLVGSACSTMSSVFATKQDERDASPIANPFSDYDAGARSENPGGTIVRSKRGDRSFEVQFPEHSASLGNMVLPVNPNFAADPVPNRLDTPYEDQKPVMADRELASSFPKVNPQHDADRRAIETTLGVTAAENDTPRQDSSYLASMDRVKLLYKGGRFEAALIEVDGLLRLYPTNPKLYEMRGTLFDRLGNRELALRSWNQALKLDPSNEGLKRFIARKQEIRGLAGGTGK